jgi:hypothetical protein
MTELKILAVQRRCRVNDVVVEAIENLLELNGKGRRHEPGRWTA